jgi:glyceraldehyde-3-phosphate dehydrogenase (NADP+)
LKTSETIKVDDPYDGSAVDTVPRGTAKHVDEAVSSAARAFKTGRFAPVHERMRILRAVADDVAGRLEEYAILIAREGSKTTRRRARSAGARPTHYR